MVDYERIQLDPLDDRPIGLELPYREQTEHDGVVSTEIRYERIVFASPAMVPPEVRRFAVTVQRTGIIDPEEILRAAAADKDNLELLDDYLERPGVSLAVLTRTAEMLAESYLGRPTRRSRRS